MCLAKLVKSLKPLAILVKSSNLDVWRILKTPLHQRNTSFYNNQRGEFWKELHLVNNNVTVGIIFWCPTFFQKMKILSVLVKNWLTFSCLALTFCHSELVHMGFKTSIKNFGHNCTLKGSKNLSVEQFLMPSVVDRGIFIGKL